MDKKIPWNKGLKGEEYKKHYKNGFGGTYIKGHKKRVGLKHTKESRLKMREAKLRDGYINKDGYKVIRFLGESYLEHRYIWQKNKGNIPIGFDIHHINHNKLDNRIENLQMLSKSNHTSKHWAEVKAKGGQL